MLAENDPRHQLYLEPIIRFALTDVTLILNGEIPEDHRTHRLSVLRNMLEGAVRQMDKVIAEENGDNTENLAQLLARKDRLAVVNNAHMQRRIMEMVSEADVPLFLKKDLSPGKEEQPSHSQRILGTLFGFTDLAMKMPDEQGLKIEDKREGSDPSK